MIRVPVSLLFLRTLPLWISSMTCVGYKFKVNNKNINHMCHSFRRGTMQMYQIREANSGGKSKKVVVYIIQKGLNHYIPIIYKIIAQLKK